MLDPRLFDLLKTLAAADLDWLAEEVIQGVSAGDVPLESEAAVIAARHDVFRERQNSGGFGNLNVPLMQATPLKGDEQLDWAVGHVVTRLLDALSSMRASTERLDALVEGADQKGWHQKASGIAGAQLVINDGEEVLGEADRDAIDAAMTTIASLKEALLQWRGASLAGGDE
jgi:hypothetical protein